MKVLVTGGAGYIGSVLVRRLLDEGYSVRVLDSLMFGGESLLEIYNKPHFEFIKGDIRDEKVLKYALNGAESVIHLAALVGHPLCQSQPSETEDVNYKAACLIFELAVKNKIKRFIFTSTCSNYGINSTKELATEDSELKPLSLYAEAKVRAEKYMLSFQKKPDFSFCILRLATIFGISPRMRFDLLINELVKDALIKKRLIVQKPSAWRPFLHVEDAANSIIRCLKAESRQISGQVFNVGCGNYKKMEVVEMIKKHVSSLDIKILEDDADNRDYKVSFEKIKDALGFKANVALEDGIIEVKDVIEKGIISDPQSAYYTNQRPANG